MVEVMKFLPREYKLILAGPMVDSGPLFKRDQKYFRSIKKLISLNSLDDRIDIVPKFIIEPEKYIKSCDIFVLPSIKEALGTTILEALACGVPVVGNNTRGVLDQWVKNGENGYTCNLNIKGWVEKIKLASEISSDKMKLCSEEILKVASTEIIDNEYYRRFDEYQN